MSTLCPHRILKGFASKVTCQPARRLSSMSGFGIDLLGANTIGSDAMRTSIRAIGDRGFLVNNVYIRSSVLLFPNSFLAWSPKKLKDITIESLEVLKLLHPTPDVVFIGCGEKMSERLPLEIVDHYRKHGIILEATDSPSAASSFTILNSEGRNVAAALLTREPVPDSWEELPDEPEDITK